MAFSPFFLDGCIDGYGVNMRSQAFWTFSVYFMIGSWMWYGFGNSLESTGMVVLSRDDGWHSFFLDDHFRCWGVFFDWVGIDGLGGSYLWVIGIYWDTIHGWYHGYHTAFLPEKLVPNFGINKRAGFVRNVIPRPVHYLPMETSWWIYLRLQTHRMKLVNHLSFPLHQHSYKNSQYGDFLKWVYP